MTIAADQRTHRWAIGQPVAAHSRDEAREILPPVVSSDGDPERWWCARSNWLAARGSEQGRPTPRLVRGSSRVSAPRLCCSFSRRCATVSCHVAPRSPLGWRVFARPRALIVGSEMNGVFPRARAQNRQRVTATSGERIVKNRRTFVHRNCTRPPLKYLTS